MKTASSLSSGGQFWRPRLVPIALGLGVALTIFMSSCWWSIFYYRNSSCSDTKPDFYAFYSGAKLMWEDRSSLYDLDKQLVVQNQIDPVGADWVLPYFYPPFFALLLVPLAWLPFSAAFALMTVINLFLLTCALRLLARRLHLRSEQARWLVLATICNFGVQYGLLQGQTSFIALLLLTVFFSASVPVPTLQSGLWAGLLSFKPQLLLVPVLVLFSRPRKPILLGFAGVVIALFILSLGVVGFEGTKQFFTMIRLAAAGHDILRIHPEGMHNLRALAYYLSPSGLTPYMWLGMGITVFAALIRYCLKPAADETEVTQRWIKLFIAMALLTPHFHDHDLALMIIPTALALKSYGQRVPPILAVSLIMLGLFPLLRHTVHARLFPIMPIIFLMLLFVDLRPRQPTPAAVR